MRYKGKRTGRRLKINDCVSGKKQKKKKMIVKAELQLGGEDNKKEGKQQQY